MADVYVKYSELKQLDDQLKSIIKELEDAANRSDELEAAIGEPYGKGRLRDAAKEFEGGWDDRRRGLAKDLTGVEQQVAGVVQGFQKWDAETTSGLSQSSGGNTTPANGPR